MDQHKMGERALVGTGHEALSGGGTDHTQLQSMTLSRATKGHTERYTMRNHLRHQQTPLKTALPGAVNKHDDAAVKGGVTMPRPGDTEAPKEEEEGRWDEGRQAPLLVRLLVSSQCFLMS